MPYQNYCLPSLRNNIGDFSNQEDLFAGTILDNILLGHEDLPISRVVEIARELDFASYVEQLPNGYQTHLLPGGRNIPGSVRTLILLARCLVCSPPLLVMGEFLPHLEPRRRERIIRYLTDKDQPWTLVAISHDPEFASRCDRVIMMRQGQIIQQGSFREVSQSKHGERLFRQLMV